MESSEYLNAVKNCGSWEGIGKRVMKSSQLSQQEKYQANCDV